MGMDSTPTPLRTNPAIASPLPPTRPRLRPISFSPIIPRMIPGMAGTTVHMPGCRTRGWQSPFHLFARERGPVENRLRGIARSRTCTISFRRGEPPWEGN